MRFTRWLFVWSIYSYRYPSIYGFIPSFLSKNIDYTKNKIPIFFRNWQCIGILENIDITKPYKINIGDLPLVVWKDKYMNKWNARMDICNHMGSKLHTGKITEKGCLKCPYHGLEFDSKNTLGEISEKDGKLFWAYLPLQSSPPAVPFYHNSKYTTSLLEIDMESSLRDSALNTMDLRHPEFVHSFGFGNSIPPENIHHYYYPPSTSPNPNNIDRFGLSFEYTSSEIMKQIHNNMKTTKNFHMFVYPSFSWSKVSFQKNNLIIGVHLLPLEKNKTRWYVTICHNYYTSEIGKQFIKMLAMSILRQDSTQMQNQYTENELKRAIMFEHVFPEEEWMLSMKTRLDEYRFPDLSECMKLYAEHSQSVYSNTNTNTNTNNKK